ncbi:MAG: hypothetical protein ACLU4P_05355 [Ruminococcus sp.]
MYHHSCTSRAGYVSATEDTRDDRTVLELIARMGKKRNRFPVGRLDKDTVRPASYRR